MKALLLLICLTIPVLGASPFKLRAERSTMDDGASVKQVVILNWAPTETTQVAVQSYQIQRKLFPYGWRDVGSASNQNMTWFDRKPAKRSSWYRIRPVFEDGPGPWSGKGYVDKLK